MPFPKWLQELNIAEQARRSGVSLWQHPQFLFLAMGLVIIGTMVFVYAVGLRFIQDPLLISLLIIALTAVLLVMAFIITRSFERLAAANRLKTEFVSIVSHQLRAPLSNLAWASEFLLQERAGKLRKKQEEYLGLVSENAERMQELVQNLLQVSRIEEGRLPLEKQPFSFPDFVEDIVKEFEPRIQQGEIALTVEGDGNVSAVTSDQQKLRQVAANLLDNAIRYAWKDGEGKRIRVRYRRAGKNVYLEVADNGIGIPAEDQPYIFERFFRSEAGRKREPHGSGLGLYIAKAFVELAGGRIGFRSQAHKGSTFWFTIPIA